MHVRVGWISAPLSATTGYGVVSNNICLRLADMGYDVVNIGGRGASVVWGERFLAVSSKGKTVRVVPAWGMTGDRATIEYYIRRYNLDVLVSLFDAFALNFQKPSKPWAAYVPIDAPLTKTWYRYLVNPDIVVAMSLFGKNELLKHFPPFMVDYIPHGVDTKLFKPVAGEEKALIRDRLGIPRDKFVALFVGANMGERKCIPQLMIAFKRLLEKHPDSVLYLLTTLRERFPQGYDLVGFSEELGISDHVMGPTSYGFPRNLTLDPVEEEELAETYACADVLVLPSMGEGFGLPILEAMSCGVPVIGVNTASMVELIQGHGWLVDTVDEDEWVDVPVWIPLLAQYRVPKICSLYQAMCDAYENPKAREEYGARSREFALEYDWDKLMPKWDSLLNNLASVP